MRKTKTILLSRRRQISLLQGFITRRKLPLLIKTKGPENYETEPGNSYIRNSARIENFLNGLRSICSNYEAQYKEPLGQLNIAKKSLCTLRLQK